MGDNAAVPLRFKCNRAPGLEPERSPDGAAPRGRRPGGGGGTRPFPRKNITINTNPRPRNGADASLSPRVHNNGLVQRDGRGTRWEPAGARICASSFLDGHVGAGEPGRGGSWAPPSLLGAPGTDGCPPDPPRSHGRAAAVWKRSSGRRAAARAGKFLLIDSRPFSSALFHPRYLR